MATPTDRDLLLGMLALQNGFIDPEALNAAFRAWTRDRAKTLAQILQDRGDLAAPRRALLDALAEELLRHHGGDIQESLASLGAAPGVDAALRGLDVEGLRDGLARAGTGRRGYDDPLALGASGTSDGDTTTVPGPTPLSWDVGASSSGRFRILRPHAEGGLGAVLVALDAELNREVAYKQIKPRYADLAESRDRFVLEAEITGGLEHPGIVPVYSLGRDDEGRPFYAMRLIRGDSLKQAVEQFHREDGARDPGTRTLELQKLLRRFLDVCDAIGYAHSRGVLHRDIKPGNIMVGRYGETLVVDWGLAKVVGSPEEGGEVTLRPPSASGSSETLPGSAIGTPQFMSPEQAAGKIGELGTRSDVYSLGATLYYVLTGKPPFEGEDVGAILQAVQRGDFPAPRLVDGSVPRPLDAICLKAMATRPEDRYETPRALADDLERWLADEPVAAFREPLAIRARRWLRRHRTLVAATTASILIGLVGLAGIAAVLTMKNRALDRQSRRAEQREELAIAAVRRFRDAIAETPQLKNQAALAPLRKTLLKEPLAFFETLTADLRSESATRPEVFGRLARASFDLAGTSSEIGDSSDAIRGFRGTIDLIEGAARPGRMVEADRFLLADAYTHLGDEQRRSGQRVEAGRSFERARTLFAELLREDPNRPGYLRGMAGLNTSDAILQRDSGRVEEALRLTRECIPLFDQLVRANPQNVNDEEKAARTLVNVGLLCRELGRSGEAKEALEKALQRLEAMSNSRKADAGDYQTDLAGVLDNLATLGRETGRLQDVVAIQARAVEVNRKLVDGAPSVTQYQAQLAMSLHNLANIQMQLDHVPEAAAGFEESRQGFERLVRTHPTVVEYSFRLASALNSIGLLSQIRKRPDEARSALVESCRILETLIKDHPEVQGYRQTLAHALIVLGPLHVSQGRIPEALAGSERAAELLEPLAREHPELPDFASNLGYAHQVSGYCEENRKQIARAAEHYRKAADAQRMAWDRNRRNSVYRNALMAHLESLAKASHQLKDAATCAQAARDWADVGAGQPTALYDAACFLSLCIPIAPGPTEAARYAGEAMETLRKALAAGYRNLGHAAVDPDLKPLRSRADFQRLVLDPIFPRRPFARPRTAAR